MSFETRTVPRAFDAIAPDGSEIRLLAALSGGSMAHCTVPAGAVTLAVCHRTIEELWYVVGGRGAIWRRHGEREEIVELVPGVSASIPLGTHFQFRAAPDEALEVVLVSMPPWPGEDEAVRVPDHWPPTVG